MGKKVTMQDIADAMGITRNTVSKAFNNLDGIAPATREKILQKAEEMGYKPFAFASPLTGGMKQHSNQESSGYQGEIALLTGSFLGHSHFALPMLDSFQTEVSRQGYTMNTHRVTEADLAGMSLPATVQPDQVKALLCVEIFDWEYASMLCRLGIPILFVDGPAKLNGRSLPADQLYMENTAPIMQFVQSMLEKGLTRIGFVGEYRHCQSFFERYTAFFLAMGMAGCPVQNRFVVDYHAIEQLSSAVRAMEELPEVFVCANDAVAWDTMRALESIGKRVPEDVMLCGFDDSAESRFSKPTMTTVHIPIPTMSRFAVQLLLSRIKTPSLDYRTVYAETELIYRESAR